MNDAGLSNSPTSVSQFEVTDEQLSAELKKWTGATPALQPVGELLDRHWEAAFAYARLCTYDARAAGMLTTAAFTRLFGETLRQTGPSAAWRPQLLVTVRRIAAEWDTERGRELLHPDLRSRAGEGDRVASRLLPPANRRLLSGAFQRLPQSARCLLWHADVESEPAAIPAALLGLEEEDARVELRRARERLREECLQVHRELAPEQECRRYQRMLDVTYRRGGIDVDPDLAAHLAGCKHCSHTADQLGQFNQSLGLALAEAVLGWGARAYVESRFVHDDGTAAEAEGERPAMAGEPFVTVPTATGAGMRTGTRRASRRSAHKAARRAAARRRNLTAAVLTVSGLIVLPLVVWSALDSNDGHTTSEAGQSADDTPSTGKSTEGNPSWVGTGADAGGAMQGRLHNVDSGLCVTVVGKKAVKGAETELAPCSTAPVQQWSYETDGRLRSGDDPGLCLDSHLGYEVQLASCTGVDAKDAKDIRYDFTLQGTLVPRWDQDLALTAAATDGSGALVLKTRDDSTAQRWVFDTSKADLQMEVVNWDAASDPTPTPTAAPTPKAAKKPSPTPTPSATPTTAQPSPTPTVTPPVNQYCYYNPYACYGGGGGGYGGGGYGGGGGGHH